VNRDAVELRLDRAAAGLGLGGLACALFTFAGATQYRLVRIEGLGLAVLAVLAVLAIVAGRLRRRRLAAVAGAGFLAAAVLQLVQLGRDANALSGDGSTFALFLGLGMGLLVVGTARVPADLAQDPTQDPAREPTPNRPEGTPHAR